MFREFQQSLTYKNYSLDSTINNLKLILRGLFQLEDYFLQAFAYSGKLYQILNDDGVISNIASFGKSDRFEDFNCKRQNQILTASKAELKMVDGRMKLFALKALKSILKLEFTDTESHLFKKHSIQIYTLHIPENKYVKKLRKEAIDLLINVFQNEMSKELKEEALKIVVDVPREIFAVRNKNYTLHLNIPYTVERFLNKIIKKDGFREVLGYIEKRFSISGNMSLRKRVCWAMNTYQPVREMPLRQNLLTSKKPKYFLTS